MGDVDPKVLKKTQDTLGKIINKPPLTDKLLTKPPFRFLHDVFTSVCHVTMFTRLSLSAIDFNAVYACVIYLNRF